MNNQSGTLPQPVRIDHLIFDLGSTLIYFDADWAALLTTSLAELMDRLIASGIELDRMKFSAQFRSRMQAYFQERETEFIEYTTAYILNQVLTEWGYPQVPDAVTRPALAAMYAVTQAHWKLEADAHPTLELLRDQGYRLGLISNAGDDADVQALVDNASLRPYFDIILTSAALGVRKPNPRIFWNALEHWGIQPSQAAMIGDTLGADILGARNAGLLSIWITRRADTPANHAHADTIQPDASIATLGELPSLLEKLNTR
jgi:HAD superfamily hydrolase (TIGR01549 family)